MLSEFSFREMVDACNLAICPGEKNTNKKTYDYESLLPIFHPAGLQHVKGRISNIHITLYHKMSLVDAQSHFIFLDMGSLISIVENPPKFLFAKLSQDI